MSEEGGADVRALIRDWIEETVENYARPGHLSSGQKAALVAEVGAAFAQDFYKCKENDRATAGKSDPYVFDSSRPLKAIGRYRIAHHLVGLARKLPETRREDLEIAAKKIAEGGVRDGGIDIHPEAEIGIPLRIDHGWGVVIGQQTRIGDNCALLNNVILGATGMDPKATASANERRHPTLGNDVQIYANASVLGDVTVHDGAVIGEGCKIRDEIPPGMTVRLVSQMEVWKSPNAPEVHGLRWPGRNCLEVWGSGLENAVPTLVDDDHEALEGVECHVSDPDEESGETIQIEVTVSPTGIEIPSPPRLKFRGLDGAVVVLIDAAALKLLWKNCDEISREPAASGAAGA